MSNEDSTIWSPSLDVTESIYKDLEINSLGLSVYEKKEGSVTRVTLEAHPYWIEKCNEIEVGDLVENSSGKVGVVLREVDRESDFRKFVISFGGNKMALPSIFLKKLETK